MRRALQAILAAHAQQYPAMGPRDAVKLLYENEFGGGHLIVNPERSLEGLRTEYAATLHDPAAPLWENIGNGMVRIHLGALDCSEYPLEALNRDFVRSAELRRGSMNVFFRKLNLLRELTREGKFGFTSEELEGYLEPYIASGCPTMSHSAVYREAYHPAYRVVMRCVCLPLLVREARAMSKKRGRVIVALDGRCASGKTTLARRLRERWGWSVLHMDHFFLRPEQRGPERYAQPGGNIDHERFLEEVLLPLRGGERVLYRPFDCHSQALLSPVPFDPSPVVMVEGSYACHPMLWKHYDLHAFLTVDRERQMERILAREGAEYAQVFQERWIPLEEQYFSACRVESRCDYRLEL